MPLCFDLDGTLGSFGGGYILLRQALGEVWGSEPSAEELSGCKGSTDWEIVDELYRWRYHAGLTEEDYAAYDRACLAHFSATFHPTGRMPVVFQGIVEGMTRLLDAGHRIWLVSGNTPSVLAFKAQALGVDERVQRLGSLPYLDRAGLIRKALEGCPGPHLYVGDRPHDREAADAAGVPFLGIGEAVPGDHPILSVNAEAEHLVQAIEALLV
jgi:phosphoglycolate phosphatase-like HAD superfamily hydrolase